MSIKRKSPLACRDTAERALNYKLQSNFTGSDRVLSQKLFSEWLYFNDRITSNSSLPVSIREEEFDLKMNYLKFFQDRGLL
jgi:hypothetical protein